MTAESNPSTRDHRAIIADMRPMQAIEYLLNALDELTPPTDVVAAWHMPGLTLRHKRCLYALARAKGKPVPPSRIVREITFSADGNRPGDKNATLAVFQIRKLLAGTGVKIITNGKAGYSLSVPEGHVWPWDKAA